MRELKRYRIDIDALRETHLACEEPITEVGARYSFFFWSVKAISEHCEDGIGFDIKTTVVKKFTSLSKG